MAQFGWLLKCCISDQAAGRRKAVLMLSAAVLFTSGLAASGVTAYLLGVLHLL